MAYGRKTGGRVKGTPNKPKPSQEVVNNTLSPAVADYYSSGKFAEDLIELTPKERITVMERLTNYVLPKKQSTNVDLHQENKPSEDFLTLLATMAECGGNSEALRIKDND